MIRPSAGGSSRTCSAAATRCGGRPRTSTAGPRTNARKPRTSVAAFNELERILAATAEDYDRLKGEHAELLETLALLRRYLFGPRRERCSDDPGQGHLFDLPAEPEPELLTPPPDDGAASPRPRSARTPRRARFEHLPHIRIEHDLTLAEKTCSCCGAPKARIGEDESRELEFIPARLEVRVHILPKYACSKCRDGVASPPAPPKPTPGGMAGPGLVAFVVVSKFADHLPLYRLEDILTRHGVYLSRSTLCDWVRDAATVLEPLAALQKTLVLSSPVIWTDDTPVTVLGGDEPGSTTGRFWTYIGDDEHPYTVYDFTMSRSRDGPAAFLSDYRGFLQADAFAGYDGIFLGSDGGVEEVACWAHARASSSTRGPMRRGRPTRSWSGSANSTTSRTGRGSGRRRSGWRCGSGRPCRSSTGSRRSWMS